MLTFLNFLSNSDAAAVALIAKCAEHDAHVVLATNLLFPMAASS